MSSTLSYSCFRLCSYSSQLSFVHYQLKITFQFTKLPKLTIFFYFSINIVCSSTINESKDLIWASLSLTASSNLSDSYLISAKKEFSKFFCYISGFLDSSSAHFRSFGSLIDTSLSGSSSLANFSIKVVVGYSHPAKLRTPYIVLTYSGTKDKSISCLIWSNIIFIN